MRMSREDAAKNRDRVVRTASRMFREDGYDGTGIAALMKAAGLTNGAFYKQFDSKEALIAEATAFGLAENAKAWEKVLEDAGDDPLKTLAEWYLSDIHMAHRGKGCTYATLASEAPRHDDELRQAFDEGLRKSLSILSESAEVDQGAAIRHLSRLIGAITLARAVQDPALAATILEANRATPAEGGSD